jgi:TRAP-type C4-dicarboxylate transport system permease large subunit
MAGLAGHALTTGGFAAALTAFVVTSVVLVALLFAAAVGAAVAQQKVAAQLEAGAATVKRWGGQVLIAVGVWLLLLAFFADTFARVTPV